MQTRKIVIGVLSAEGYHERRQACLDSWADSKLDQTVEIVFLVGDTRRNHPVREGSILYCPCPDDYASLPQKTRWFCLWALDSFDFDFLFKCDDDTYVCVDRLKELTDEVNRDGESPDYLGHDMGGYASGGAGYLLSRIAALSVVGRLLEATGAEDVLVGAVLKQAGIELTSESRFHPWNDLAPTVDNELVTTHYIAATDMRRLHSQLVSTGSRPSLAPNILIPKVFHHVWFGGKPMPEEFRDYINSWRKHHPDWKFKLWNEDNIFPLQNQAEFDSAGQPAQKADIARYEILLRKGGVYLDTDFECFKSIEPLLGNTPAFAAEEDDDSIAIGIIGAVQGHPLLQEVVDALPASFAAGGNPCQTTGPQLFTRLARGNEDLRVFDRQLFYPVHYNGRVWGGSENAYALHHWAKSWN